MKLVLVTPGDHGRGRDLRPWLQDLQGATVLLREPHLDAPELDALCRHVRAQGGVPWLHDRAPGARAVARALQLHLHLRAGTPPPAGLEHSVSCHSAAEVDAALEAGASEVFLSPVWRPTSKPEDRRPPLGLEGFLALAGGRPVLALGGVSPARARSLRDQGGYGVAVLGGVFRAATPSTARLELEQLLSACVPQSP